MLSALGREESPALDESQELPVDTLFCVVCLVLDSV